MKTTIWIVIICLGTAAPLFANDTNVLSNEKARVSYAIGMTLGHNWQQQGLDADPEIVARGLKDVQSGGPTLLSQEEMRDTLSGLNKELAAKQQKMRAEVAAKNKAEGEAFLATNKNNPGVVVLPDGLQYKVITNGTGAMPAPTNMVTVNYRGMLLDGTEFDSSFKRGQPHPFPVTGVIPGWTEALLKMKTGSRWQLFVPPELAYGERGRPGIPPNSVLIFEVDLLSTESPPPPPPPAPAIRRSPATSSKCPPPMN